MDELLKQMSVQTYESAASFTYAEFALSLVLSVALALVVVWAYRRTHSGTPYSRSFAVTMILMSFTVSFIMLIIGSNLARAFSLVGALSIIRYRNAVRESRDTAFIFLSMAVGMACGVRLYVQAGIFTALAAGLVFLLDRVQFASAGRDERLLRLSFAKKTEAGGVEKKLGELCAGRCALLSSETAGDRYVLIYSVEVDAKRTASTLLEEVSKQFSKADVKLLTGFEKFNI